MKLTELIEQASQEYSLWVDLDGVLADFNAGVDKILKTVYGPDEHYSEEKYQNDRKYRDKMWRATEKYQQELGGQLWYELPLLDDAMTLWNYVKPYDPQILTATGTSSYDAGRQKRQWVSEHFGSSVPVNLVQKAAEKQQYADNNHILIDDKEKAIKPWREAGGIGILHTSAAETIKQLKQLGL